MSRNPYPKQKQVCVHPLLFAIYPIVYLFFSNFDFVTTASLIRPLVLNVSVVSVIWLAINHWTGNPQKGALALSFSLLALFSYGAIYDYLQRTGFRLEWQQTAFMEKVLLLCGLIILAGGVYVLVSARSLGAWTYLLNVVGSILVLFMLVQMLKVVLQRPSSFTLLPEFESGIAPPDGQIDQTLQPDIYLIVLDGYGRSDVLAETYNCDNSNFLQRLRDRGFFVAERSHANYLRTDWSIASTLNADYLDALFVPHIKRMRDREPLRRLVQRNRTMRFLKSAGYKIVDISTQYDNLNLGDLADVYLTRWWFPTPLEIALAGMTPLPTIARKLGQPVLYDLHRNRIQFVLEQLSRSAELPGPKVVFAHLFSPHAPFVFGPNGGKVHSGAKYSWEDGLQYLERTQISEDEYCARYCGQLTYLSRQMTIVVDRLLRQSTRPPIIVLQADHGPGMLFEEVSLDSKRLVSRFGILNALHLPQPQPETLRHDLSAVNTFRIIFNRYFNTDLEILEDEAYFSEPANPYKYYRVTADLKQLVVHGEDAE